MPLTLPSPSQAALLLDVDGTLLDFAPTPESVIVPPGLIDTLHRLRTALGDALAVVSGRPIEQVDALLDAVPYAVAGEHGGALRRQPGAPIERPDLPTLPPDWLPAADAIAASHPGTRVERKQRGFVLHYRQAPDSGPALRQAALALIAPRADQFQLLEAALAWEIRPLGMDKGLAVATLMAHPPFAGRLPIYIGDDITDEDAIRAAQAAGGAGMLVAPIFGTPAGVRSWLATAAEALAAGRAFPPP